jgi:hypothetical protein
LGNLLSQAEMLSLGSDEAQVRLLEQLVDNDADEIRGHLLDDRPTVVLAILTPEKYPAPSRPTC